MSNLRVGLYARVSTDQQTCDNQLEELRRYALARGWATQEFVDHAVSGSVERRPALDAMLVAAKRRKLDAVVCWRLDRLGRSLRHLVTLIEDLQGLGVTFISLGEGIDFGTAAGRLQLHILAALSQFERERLRERVLCGLQRARAQGKRLGRPKGRLPVERLATVAAMSHADAAASLGVSMGTVRRWRRVQKSLIAAA